MTSGQEYLFTVSALNGTLYIYQSKIPSYLIKGTDMYDILRLVCIIQSEIANVMFMKNTLSVIAILS